MLPPASRISKKSKFLWLKVYFRIFKYDPIDKIVQKMFLVQFAVVSKHLRKVDINLETYVLY